MHHQRSQVADALNHGQGRFDGYNEIRSNRMSSALQASSDPAAAAAVEAVPSAYAEHYDPQAEGADWSGFVPKAQSRAHVGGRAHTVQMQPGRGGYIMP
jgi:hypothetical protein